jgi:uncharacterized membrane protein YkgB
MIEMNESMTLLILSVFDVVILMFGVYFFYAGIKMQKTKEIGNLILAEEEVKRCENREALADFFYWREEVLGGVFVLFGIIRLLDKYVLKIGGMLDGALMVILLITALCFYKSLMTARTKFLS